MNKLLTALIAGLLVAPAAIADPIIPRWKTEHSMGCMLLRECVEDTYRVHSVADIEKQITHPNYEPVRAETDAILAELEKMGVEIYLADDKYFVRNVAGLYHVGENKFYLNDSWVDDPYQMLQTVRHEAWHAAQDQQACGINNTFMAVIMDDKEIPQNIKLLTEISYPENVRPWEQEAKWAGETENMTLNILRLMNENNGRLWDVMEPTPMTREWLESRGCM